MGDGFVIIALLIVGVFIFFGILLNESQSSRHKKILLFFHNSGFDKDSKIITGRYLAGHPNIDDSVNKTLIYLKKDDPTLYFFKDNDDFDPPTELGSIPTESITDIVAEDKSTMEKRVTVGRLLLVGIFAFAWKKKKVNESAFLIIEWNKGKFKNETIFEFEGRNAMSSANTVRNRLIEIVNAFEEDEEENEG